jgi:hypothetical protein
MFVGNCMDKCMNEPTVSPSAERRGRTAQRIKPENIYRFYLYNGAYKGAASVAWDFRLGTEHIRAAVTGAKQTGMDKRTIDLLSSMLRTYPKD